STGVLCDYADLIQLLRDPGDENALRQRPFKRGFVVAVSVSSAGPDFDSDSLASHPRKSQGVPIGNGAPYESRVHTVSTSVKSPREVECLQSAPTSQIRYPWQFSFSPSGR